MIPISDSFEANKSLLYQSCVEILTKYVTEEGYIGQEDMSIIHKRRLTHQYISSMLLSGFAPTTQVLQKALAWLKDSLTATSVVATSTHPLDQYFVLDVVEASLRMDKNDEYANLAVDILLSQRKGFYIDSPSAEPRRDYFFTLWAAKIFLYSDHNPKARKTSEEIVKDFTENYENLLPNSRELCFLISLYTQLWPKASLREAPLSDMLNKLVSEGEQMLFDVRPDVRSRLDQLHESGLNPYNVSGIASNVHWALISTSYVIENLAEICGRSKRLTNTVREIAAAYFDILKPAIQDIEMVFDTPYQQVMLAARTLSAYATFTGEDIAKHMVPHFLEQTIRMEMDRKSEERAKEKRQLQDVIKKWLPIDWSPADEERLAGGYSTAKVIRVKPRIEFTNDFMPELKRQSIPFIDSLILKFGRKMDLDTERTNYTSIPIDFRNLFASIPSNHIIQSSDEGEIVEYLVIEDLIGFRTIQEILPNVSKDFGPYLFSKLTQFLRHFYTMPIDPGNKMGLIRKIYIFPIMQNLEIIFDFKQKIQKKLDDDDINLLTALNNLIPLSSQLETFKPTVMHGDLNIRNVLLTGKQVVGSDLQFKMIDLDKFTRFGDYTYDVGEFLVDLEIFVQRNKVHSSSAHQKFEQTFFKFAEERGDKTFPIRLELAKARSISKLLKIQSKLALEKFGQNPLHDKEVERTFDEIQPMLKQLSNSLFALYDKIG